MTGDGKGSGRWDWSHISVAALAIIAIAAGVQLVSVTPEGTSEAGVALVVLGAVLAGAWIATKRDRG